MLKILPFTLVDNKQNISSIIKEENIFLLFLFQLMQTQTTSNNKIVKYKIYLPNMYRVIEIDFALIFFNKMQFICY